MNKLLILGAGGHGRVVKEVAESMKRYDEISFLDDNIANTINSVIGKLDDYSMYTRDYEDAIVAIGNPDIRKQYTESLKEVGFNIPALVHSEAYVSDSASIAQGTVVMAKAVVQACASISEGCIISAGAIIDHDAIVGAYSHINAGAIVPSMSCVPVKTKVNYKEVYETE